MQNIETVQPVASPVTVSASDSLALAARVLIAAIFVISGFGKLTDPAGTAGYVTAMGLPLPEVATWIAIAVELGAGIALAVGYPTRSAAAILAVFSLATAVLFHADIGDQNQFIHFFKNVALAGGLLQVAAFGSGRLSVDAAFSR